MNVVIAHDLVALLNHGLEDTTRTDEIVAEIQDNLARTGQWVATAAIPTVPGQAAYTFSTTSTIEILHVFANGYDLARTNAEDLEIHPTWREEQGFVEAYTVNQEAELTLRLYPTPDSVVTLFIVAATRRVTFQTWLSPWLALHITAKEFQREGPEQDMAYAQAVATVADFLAQGVLKIDNFEGPRTRT